MEIHAEGSRNKSNIANVTEEGYAHKFSNLKIDGIFGTTESLLAMPPVSPEQTKLLKRVWSVAGSE